MKWLWGFLLLFSTIFIMVGIASKVFPADTSSLLVSILTLLVTVLVGWQIWNTVENGKKINDLDVKYRQINEISAEFDTRIEAYAQILEAENIWNKKGGREVVALQTAISAIKLLSNITTVDVSNKISSTIETACEYAKYCSHTSYINQLKTILDDAKSIKLSYNIIEPLIYEIQQAIDRLESKDTSNSTESSGAERAE